uniref:Uncharacterized protein n=1 Tax=Pseudomonas aeruginosa TaxID=287 RepID=A0A7S5YEA8_PSEAI|nr:hypothetical protein [Pseudomonas aeruginosa]
MVGLAACFESDRLLLLGGHRSVLDFYFDIEPGQIGLRVIQGCHYVVMKLLLSHVHVSEFVGGEGYLHDHFLFHPMVELMGLSYWSCRVPPVAAGMCLTTILGGMVHQKLQP